MTIRSRLLVLVLAFGLLGCGEDAPPADSPNDAGASAGKPGPEMPGPAKKGFLGIPAGKVVYKRTGAPEGTITVWFQDHGATVVYDEDTRHKDLHNHKRIIWRGGVTTIHDYVTKKTTTHKMRVRATELGWNPTISEENLDRVGYVKLGTETMLGVECTVWVNSKQRVKAWVYEKLPLREVIGESYSMEATAFEQLDAIPAEAFELPGS
ncbi:MAG: hypothetical protein QNJ98_16835 [Planctomycetota bacterium]|nr:hypothetical protein [Planctomycetota bacterium]